MVGGVDMAEIVDICRHRLVLPAVAAEKETPLRAQTAARRKNLSTRASRSGRRLPRKARSARKLRLRAHREMGGGIEGIVDRNAVAHPEGAERLDHRIAAAVGEDQVVTGQERPQGIGRVLRQPVEGRRGVDIPVDRLRPGLLQCQDLGFRAGCRKRRRRSP